VSKPAQQHGLLVLDKPKGPTSAGCLERVKKRLGQRKIGHAGTLDPMASGVLLVLLGKCTKLAPYMQEGRKVYAGELVLGTATDTYDMEGEVTGEAAWEHLEPAQVQDEVAHWRTLTSQIVPPYSAAKHKGQPLYRLSREGKTPPVKEKPVEIFRAEVLSMDLPRVRFRVECGSGTYIRSLVHSLGIRLGCGAVLSELIREQSHPFSLDRAVGLESLLEEPERLAERVIPPADALPHWPAVTLDRRQADQVRNGAMLEHTPALSPGAPFAPGLRARFLAPDGALLALVEARLRDGAPVWAILRGLWA
jgi:tRNA pseudouridine55 synthase